jgi:hypothetical protein
MLPGQSATVPMGVGFVYSIPLQIKGIRGRDRVCEPYGVAVHSQPGNHHMRTEVIAVMSLRHEVRKT